jgi:hypothetical protein
MVSASWDNDVGCHGYYDDYDTIMGCIAVAIDTQGHKDVLRQGYYNPEGNAGFGREKAYLKHNLWVQPILDALTFSHTIHVRDDGNREYLAVFHQTPGGDDIAVWVVIDLQKFYGSINTPDHQELGVLTAYCANPQKKGEPVEPLCPNWVNTGPYSL